MPTLSRSTVPLMLEEAGLGDYIVEQLELGGQAPDLEDWRALVRAIGAPKATRARSRSAASTPSCTTPI